MGNHALTKDKDEAEVRELIFVGTSHLHHLKPYLTEMLQTQGWFLNNFHHSPGFLTKRGGRISKEWIDKLKTYLAENKHKIIIFLNIGSNDLRIQRHRNDPEKKSVDEVFEYIEEVNEVVKFHENAEIILSGLVPDATHDGFYKKEFRALSYRLREYSIMEGLLYFNTPRHLVVFGWPNLDLFQDLPKRKSGKKKLFTDKRQELPITNRKGIHLNEIGNTHLARKITQFLAENFHMQRALVRAKILPTQGNNAEVVSKIRKVFERRETGNVKHIKVTYGEPTYFSWPRGCQWCSLAIYFCNNWTEFETHSSMREIDSILEMANQVVKNQKQLKKLELYELAVQEDSLQMLKRFESSMMSHITDRIKSYVLGEDVNQFIEYTDTFVVEFKYQIGRWAREDICYRVITEHVSHKLEDHLRMLYVYPMFNTTNYGFKWSCLGALLAQYEKMIALVRNIEMH